IGPTSTPGGHGRPTQNDLAPTTNKTIGDPSQNRPQAALGNPQVIRLRFTRVGFAEAGAAVSEREAAVIARTQLDPGAIGSVDDIRDEVLTRVLRPRILRLVELPQVERGMFLKRLK